MYQKGEWVEANLGEAIRLFELAAELENKDAIAALEELQPSN